MGSPIDTALSALNAASTRLSVAASNIANKDSTKTIVNGQVVNKPYTPQVVDQISLSNGGVLALAKDAQNPTQEVPDLQSSTGLSTTIPNVDLGNEMVQMSLASHEYKAALKIIKMQQDLDKSLLDIKS